MRSQSLNFSKLPDRSLEIISKLLRQSGTSPSNSLINIRPQECELCDITSIFMSLFHPKMHPPPPWLTVTPRKLFLLLFLLLSFLFLFFPFFFSLLFFSFPPSSYTYTFASFLQNVVPCRGYLNFVACV